jgi:hypothetical protein
MKIISILLFSLILCSCKSANQNVTLIPPPIKETQPSWDNQEQNSGLITYVDNVGFLITPGAAQRYRNLTEKFGSTLTPPVEPGEGLLPYGGNFILTPEYMAVFMEVSRINKQ